MRNERRPVEKILVAKTNGSTGLAVVADGTTRLTNQSTYVTNLADGQLGFFDASGDGTNTINVSVSPGDTVNDSPVLMVAQGTPSSANPTAISVQGFFPYTYESDKIVGKNIQVWKGQAYVAPTLAAWSFGGDATSANAIVPADSAEFDWNITLIGRRKEHENSIHQRQLKAFSFVTPDYTTLGTADPLDHLVQNIVDQTNKQSVLYRPSGYRGTYPFVAFAIDTDGITATTGSVAISLISAGTSTINGVVLTAEMKAAFEAIALDADQPDIDGSSLIVPIDLDTAGNGSTATTKAVVILSLTEPLSYVDRVPQTAVNLQVGLSNGFSYPTVRNVESQSAFDGEGTSRQWKIYYEGTSGQRKYSQNRYFYPAVAPPAYVVEGETYDAYIIQHYLKDQAGVGSDSLQPRKTIILVPASDTATKAQLESVLNPWIQSGSGLQIVTL